MDSGPRDFVFRHVYEMAALVEEHVREGLYIEDVPWEHPDVQIGIAKPQRVSLLGHYVFNVIRIHHSREWYKNPDPYDEYEVQQIEELFEAYDVSHTSFHTFATAHTQDADVPKECVPIYDWYESDQGSFHELWEKPTDETFHILFGNRSLLPAFNQAVADHLSENPKLVPVEYRTANGRVKRQPIPRWVRKAVLFRDQGRCVLCHCDLTGLISTDRIGHYDHIVPLAQWGTNNPCNLQFALQQLQLAKSRRRTGNQ